MYKTSGLKNRNQANHWYAISVQAVTNSKMHNEMHIPAIRSLENPFFYNTEPVQKILKCSQSFVFNHIYSQDTNKIMLKLYTSIKDRDHRNLD